MTDLYLAIGFFAYAIVVVLIYRNIARRWRTQFRRVTRGESVMIGIMSVIAPAGLLVIVTESAAINNWLNKEWGQ